MSSESRSSEWYLVADDMRARDLWVRVPLDWDDPQGEMIEVFAREIHDATISQDKAQNLPPIIYLQGGPGGKGNRPSGRDAFLTAALKRFRVVMPDQRGTGRSTPVQPADFVGLSAEVAAKRLSLYRQDSIIKDFERLRSEHFGGQKWWSIGQSYGGFLTLHYLSVAPEALTASVITGGLPSLDPDADAVYEATFERMRDKNEAFFARFAHLRPRVERIAAHLRANDVRLPDGDRLTVQRFQGLGLMLGMSPGFDRVHWILEEAFADTGETVLSETFKTEVWQATAHRNAPLYMLLQEAIYGAGPTRWAASRALAEQPEFAVDASPLMFTGEMAFEWMADELSALQPFAAGWRELHEHTWPIDLYDHEQLAKNEVPVEAIAYSDDMFVEEKYSLDTAKRVRGLNVWITNEYDHDGIRASGVVEKLIKKLEVRLNT